MILFLVCVREQSSNKAIRLDSNRIDKHTSAALGQYFVAVAYFFLRVHLHHR